MAHSDVVKAQIQVAQRTRDAQDAELAALKSRLGLSVLVFPDFRDTFTVVDDLQTIAPLPPLADVKASAEANSPDVRAAEASVQQETSGIEIARGGVLPSVSFDYFYGINANQFATHDPEGNRLLGSVAQVQLNVPLWSWGAAQSKLTQAQLREQAAKGDLTLAQRQLQASVTTFHREAEIARDQVASLRESLDLADREPAADRAPLRGRRSLGARGRRRAHHAHRGAQRLRRWTRAVSRRARRAADADRNAVTMRHAHSPIRLAVLRASLLRRLRSSRLQEGREEAGGRRAGAASRPPSRAASA